jgi:hypothetical protein
LTKPTNSGRKTWVLAVLILLASVDAHARKLPHYVFILPDGYTGWVQIIFQSPGEPGPPETLDKITITLDDSGVYKTGMHHAYFVGSHDEFFYRRVIDGKETLVPMPSNFYCNEDSGLDSCFRDSKVTIDAFTVSRATVGVEGPSSSGNSWFFFIGPPESRERHKWSGTPKYRTEPHSFGMKVDQPEFDPTPGRIKND